MVFATHPGWGRWGNDKDDDERGDKIEPHQDERHNDSRNVKDDPTIHIYSTYSPFKYGKIKAMRNKIR